MYCYRTWGWFTHAYNDAFRVLEQLRFSHFLPNSEFGEAKIAGILLEVVASIVRAVAMSRHIGDHQYSRVLLLLSEIKPWVRILDANAHEKLLKVCSLDG